MGSQKNGTFRVLTKPNGRKLGACRIQFAGKASALLGRRADIICRATSPKLAPRSNSFAPDGHPCQSGERFVWMGGVTPPPRLWLYSEVLQAMWSPQSDHVLPLKITVGDVVPAGCSGTALALYMARDDAIVDPIPKT